MGEPCGFECRNMSLVVSNYGGTTPLSPAYTLHVLTSSGSSLRQASQNGFSDNYIRDVAAAEARSALSILLYELQEGLVVKLLLPTEPTTPAPPFSISASRRSSKSDNRISYLTVANPQDCWQESRPLLQRFKKLFNFGDVALSSECPVTSPDTVTHADEEYSPSLQASAYNTFHTAKLFPPSKYTEICGTQFNKNSCVVTVPKVCDGYDDESRVSDSLQPISPICNMEDVTSVQLLLIRIHLDAPLHSQSTLHGAETVENFSVVVTIDYAIKIQGNQETRTQETTNESSWSSTEGDKGDTHTFGCARIVSAPYSRQSNPLGSIPPLMPATASSIMEPLGAAITVSQYQQSTGLRPYDAVIQLDYEYLLTELMRIVSCALRRMSYS